MVNKKVFYIEKVEFLRSMMEFALKARGAEIYTVATLENNFYLLDDLRPQLVLFDVQTCIAQLPQLVEYSASSGAILVGIGDESDRALVGEMVKSFMLKPLEAKNIGARILALLD